MDEFPSGAPRRAGTLDLPPRKVKGWVHEVRIPLVKGESLRWETRHTLGAGIIAFNLHSHKGREVTHHATADRSEASGTFPAPWAGDFYVMWENRSEREVSVTYALERVGNRAPE
ncbi:MAG: hypothetical protein E6K13_02480 [Methanobacteriota archaeon]|nr:MAG: hypothetical protein E6K13_02480 [Euryarchaeota archaeon]